VLHPYFWVVGLRGGSGDKDQRRLRTGGAAGFVNQPLSDPLALVFDIDCKIGKIAAIGEVRDGAGNTDETAGITCRNNQVGLAKHSFQTRKVIGRASFSEGRRHENGLECFCR